MKNKSVKTKQKKPINTQTRQQRYEATTPNKPCTVRAPVEKHELIKRFGKTGRCNKCDNTYSKYKKNMKYWKDQLDNFKSCPSWSDEFSKRDRYVAIFCFTFAYIFYLLNVFISKLVF